MVLTIIVGVFKRIGFPLAILCLLSLWGKKRAHDKVNLFSIALLGLLWRTVYFSKQGFSSRYCIIFLLFAIILAVISLAEAPKTLSIFLVLSITVYQLYDSYDDYRKLYISDTREYLSVLANRDPATYIMIQEKEYNKINNSTGKYALLHKDLESEKGANQILDYYDIMGCNKVYVATSDKRAKEHNTNLGIKETYKSKTGKKDHNYFTVYSIDVQETEKPSYIFEATSNPIFNGNFERIEKKEQTNRLLKEWIDAGCDFYDNDLLVLPMNHYLLRYWIVPRTNEYPKVCLTNMNPIEGNYSLFVEFQEKGLVFLLEKIEKKRGCLSFKIQSLDSKTHVTISEYACSRDLGLLNVYKIKDLIILDNEIHQISIVIPKRDNNEQQSYFSISGCNTAFKLDDLSYHYYQSQ